MKRPFDISHEWALYRALENDLRCEVTAIPFFAEQWPRARTNPYRPSLDRIDCDGGYTTDNVRVVLWVVNSMLMDWGLPMFDRMARAYLMHEQREK